MLAQKPQIAQLGNRRRRDWRNVVLVALELHGIRYDDVKGSYMGLCFSGQPAAYAFRTTGAKQK